MEEPRLQPDSAPRQGLVRLALGVGLGSLVEYYDFFIALLGASVVWPTVFFSWANSAAAYGLSLASFGVLYFTRPIGAYIFGHYGDRLGRRSMVLATLSIMGVGMLGVGLDPGYDSLGMWSVFLLFLFRTLFGLGLGGEFGGASSWLVEASRRSRWRAFWALWAAPSQIGYALASFSFTLVATMFGRQFMTVGWRIPFLIGGVLIVIAVAIRYSLEESPLFRELRQRSLLERNPVSAAVRQRWKDILLLSGVMLLVLLPPGALQAPYGIAYLSAKGVSGSFVTYSIGIAAVIGSVFLVLGGISGEVLGRKRTLYISALVALLGVVLYFPLIDTLDGTYIVIAQTLVQVPTAAALSMTSVIFAEYFPTKFRYSASGMSFQIGGLYYGIVVAIIEPVIFSAFGILPSAMYIIALMVLAILISLVCTIKLKETSGDRISV